MKIRGTTKECLQHYLDRLPPWRRSTGNPQGSLADFVGVETKTTQRWKVGETFPIGLDLTKTRYFLEHKGYEVVELRELDPLIYRLGKLLAFRKLDVPTLLQEIRIKNAQQLYRVLNLTGVFMPDRMAIVATICDELDPQGQQSITEQPAVVRLSSETAPVDTEALSIGALRVLNHAIGIVKPLVEQLLADRVTPDARQAFRERAGRELVFDLANRMHECTQLLNALCSERSRDHANGRGNDLTAGRRGR